MTELYYSVMQHQDIYVFPVHAAHIVLSYEQGKTSSMAHGCLHSRMLKHLCTFGQLIRTPFFDSVTSSLRKHKMVFRFIRRRFFSNKKWVLLLVVYLVGIYYLANMLTRVVDKYDTIKQGGEKGKLIVKLSVQMVKM